MTEAGAGVGIAESRGGDGMAEAAAEMEPGVVTTERGASVVGAAGVGAAGVGAKVEAEP